jgi:hypothetical protein
VGYEEGGDLTTRVYGKLVGEFFEGLGRVVVGAEVFVNGLFKKPDGLIGPYMIVAAKGAEFGPNAAKGDRDLVAVDLSASGIRSLPQEAFYACVQLAAVAFPPELESIGGWCFCCCSALRVADLAVTQLRKLERLAFALTGVVRMSVPTSLREMGVCVFVDAPLKVLDLSACAGIRIEKQEGAQPMELSLPREGFAEAAKAFVAGAALEVLRADVDDVDIIELLPFLGGSAVDKLRFVSPRMGEYEWQRPPQSVLVELTDPAAVSAAAAVTMTAWRPPVPAKWKPFLRVIDLSGITIDLMPTGASFQDFHWLERVVLPARLRVLPENFFFG